ncbi:MAG: hypothetical protein EHM12_06975, partial [Dehalococcoidia bacterium]
MGQGLILKMSKPALVLPYRKRLIFLLATLLVSFSLACVSGIPGIGRQQNVSPSPDVVESGAASSDEPSAIIKNTPETTENIVNTSGETDLAGQQILILPGSEPPTFDPHLSSDATSAEYVVEIFSGLMAYDPELNLIPDIAESYQISDDGLVYTFKIKPAARFQDGKSIRAKDFKWSFERACDPATGSYTADTYMGDIAGCRDKLQGQAGAVAGVKVVDDLTLQLTIDEPKSFFLAKMSYPTAYVLDQENVESDPAWSTHPNGSGPFRLAQAGQNKVVLRKNDNYYRDPKPILDRVIYLINAPIDLMTGYEHGLPEDIITSYELPEGSTYDIIPVSLADFYRATDPHNVLSREFTSSKSLNVFYIAFNVKKPPFDDVKIRQAFNLALDKPRIVKLMYHNTTPIANGIVPPGIPGYENPDLSDHQFDPERARQLITESSYGDV